MNEHFGLGRVLEIYPSCSFKIILGLGYPLGIFMVIELCGSAIRKR